MPAAPPVRVRVVAPSRRLEEAMARAVADCAERSGVALEFHPQCFESSGHFAGPDAHRLQAFVETANDPGVDAVWFARGGYGAGRFAPAVPDRLTPAARAKTYLGYSDGGFLLATLYRHGVGRVAHGPMVGDIVRPNGERAIARALAFLADALEDGIFEPTKSRDGHPVAAFNLSVLSQMLATPMQPNLSGHILHLEDVGEQHYRLDRALCHIFNQPWATTLKGLRLGRCSDIPENDIAFAQDEVAIAKHWAAHAGVPYLGRSDIGHDADNKIIVFGPAQDASQD